MKNITKFGVFELPSSLRKIANFSVSSADLSSWRVGGSIAILLRPRSTSELIEAISHVRDKRYPHLVIGNCTNLLFPEEGLHGVVIQLSENFSKVYINNNYMNIQSGAWVPNVAIKAMRSGLSGIEHICGIPGTIGGLVWMNGGSQRKTISKNVLFVQTINKAGESVAYNRIECLFGYRRSLFQDNGDVIIGVTLKLRKGRTKADIRREMIEILNDRRKKFPRKLPNAGSVFVSNTSLYADHGPPGQLIEKLGLKGLRQGGAMVSPQHGNFIVNIGGATTMDILVLIKELHHQVYEQTGYSMEVEPRLVTSKCEVMRITPSFNPETI